MYPMKNWISLGIVVTGGTIPINCIVPEMSALSYLSIVIIYVVLLDKMICDCCKQ